MCKVNKENKIVCILNNIKTYLHDNEKTIIDDIIKNFNIEMPYPQNIKFSLKVILEIFGDNYPLNNINRQGVLELINQINNQEIQSILQTALEEEAPFQNTHDQLREDTKRKCKEKRGNNKII